MSELQADFAESDIDPSAWLPVYEGRAPSPGAEIGVSMAEEQLEELITERFIEAKLNHGYAPEQEAHLIAQIREQARRHIQSLGIEIIPIDHCARARDDGPISLGR